MKHTAHVQPRRRIGCFEKMAATKRAALASECGFGSLMVVKISAWIQGHEMDADSKHWKNWANEMLTELQLATLHFYSSNYYILQLLSTGEQNPGLTWFQRNEKIQAEWRCLAGLIGQKIMLQPINHIYSQFTFTGNNQNNLRQKDFAAMFWTQQYLFRTRPYYTYVSSPQ